MTAGGAESDGQPTTRHFSFIGVTTQKSAIMRVFPAWARHLGLAGADIVGYDFPLHAEPQRYREVVEHIRDSPAEAGGLVTTHKIDLFQACRDIFDFIDPYAELCGEVSSLSKRDGQFRAHAKDPISSGRSIDEFVPEGYWGQSGAQALLFGAGGSNLAITVHLLSARGPDDRPSRVVVVNRSPGRLEAMRSVHRRLGVDGLVEYVHNADASHNDALVSGAPPGSLVVNGTGMGKDSPGSPITGAATFPEKALVWELNYRGELDFLHQARDQQAERQLLVVDGWRYFVHGWTCVVEEVFGIEMTPALVDELASIAESVRN